MFYVMLMKIGDNERAILSMLQDDCKQSLKSMSKKLGMPMSTIHEKIRKMEAEGIIKGYTAVVDAEKIGFAATAFILVRIDTRDRNGKPISAKDVADRLGKIENIESVSTVTGEYDFVLKVRGRDIQDIGNVIMQVRATEGISTTITMESFHAVKDSGRLPIQNWKTKA